jgi:hypothetical protein
VGLLKIKKYGISIDLELTRQNLKETVEEAESLLNYINHPYSSTDYKDEIEATRLLKRLEEWGLEFEMFSKTKLNIVGSACPDDDLSCEECTSFVCEDSVNYDENWINDEPVKEPNWKKAYGLLMDYGWDYIPEEDRPELSKRLKRIGL